MVEVIFHGSLPLLWTTFLAREPLCLTGMECTGPQLRSPCNLVATLRPEGAPRMMDRQGVVQNRTRHIAEAERAVTNED